MENTFDQGLCLAYLKKGRLRSAMEYLAQFPEQAELCRRCTSLFQQENYLSYDVDGSLQDILLAYQKYYRDAFYLEQRPEEAAERLRARLAGLLPADCGAALDAQVRLIQDLEKQKEQTSKPSSSREPGDSISWAAGPAAGTAPISGGRRS